MAKTKIRPPLKQPREVEPELSPASEPLSTAGQWIGWGVWGSFVLVGFCFGVWAGTPKSGPTSTIEVAAVTPKPETPAKAEPVKTEPAKPEPKAVVVTPKVEPKKPDAETAPVVTPTPKPPEPKPVTPAPKPPEPKPVTPKPPEPAPTAVANVSFAKDILPIIRSSCLNCHGIPQMKAGLDMRTVASTLKGGDNGPGVKAGSLKDGTIWKSIEDGEMPPAGKTPLTAMEKKLFQDWILGGAKP